MGLVGRASCTATSHSCKVCLLHRPQPVYLRVLFRPIYVFPSHAFHIAAALFLLCVALPCFSRVSPARHALCLSPARFRAQLAVTLRSCSPLYPATLSVVRPALPSLMYAQLPHWHCLFCRKPTLAVGKAENCGPFISSYPTSIPLSSLSSLMSAAQPQLSLSSLHFTLCRPLRPSRPGLVAMKQSRGQAAARRAVRRNVSGQQKTQKQRLRKWALPAQGVAGSAGACRSAAAARGDWQVEGHAAASFAAATRRL